MNLVLYILRRFDISLNKETKATWYKKQPAFFKLWHAMEEIVQAFP